ncbi:MAG: substrate-binding domain-containing protein [Geminicoccaceae bacterium]
MSRLRTLFFGLWLAFGGVSVEARDLVLAATTSTDNSGLLDHLTGRFEDATGIRVRAVVVGSGAALGYGRRGDVDVLLTHAPEAEQRFVAAGFARERVEIMTNDYVLVGPSEDPADVKSASDIGDAFERIAVAGARFASRGDDSGTHQKERDLWMSAGRDPDPAEDRWYSETGSGQGATLNVAVNLAAYLLVDRATWLAYGQRSRAPILFEGDPALTNVYAVLPVDAVRHPHTAVKEAESWVRWLTSVKGRQAINDFRIDGEQAFFPLDPVIR